jgi:predicted phage replisome organizer
MAKYDKDTKFYWLQLKEDFFEDDAIEWLEEQQPNGRDYAYFYLKLCLKSLKSNGILIRNVGDVLIPYDNKKLAEITKMDFDTVTVAMELLKQIGLVKILEHGEIYVSQLENLIGSVSKGALKKQQQRFIENKQKTLGETKGGQMSTKDKDKDKDKDKTKDIIKNKNKFLAFYENYPRKVKKNLVEKWFEKNKPDDELFKKIMESLEKFKKTDDWNKDNGQFIPYPSSWLNQKRWEDEIEVKLSNEEKRELLIKKLEENIDNDN